MTDDTPETVGDLDDPDRELWVMPRTRIDRVVHTDPECPKLGKDAIETEARLEHIDTPVCRFCSGRAETDGGSGPQLARRLREVGADD